jgi:hypothetical protein
MHINSKSGRIAEDVACIGEKGIACEVLDQKRLTVRDLTEDLRVGKSTILKRFLKNK